VFVLQSGAFKVSKEGYVVLQFAPSVGADEPIYDWNQKQVTCASSMESILRSRLNKFLTSTNESKN